MRSHAAVAALLALAAVLPASAARKPTQPPSQVSGPPHAWLFGTWTGGLFPVLDGMTAQDCSTQPTVVFSKDDVSHATLLGTTMARRAVETVRTTPAGAEFRFTPVPDPAAGFGCENPDELHVARTSANVISFPRCSAFPYPLERCPAR